MNFPFLDYNGSGNNPDRQSYPWYSSEKFQKFWSSYNQIMFYAHKDAILKSNEVSKRTAATLNLMVKRPHSEKRKSSQIKKNKKKSKTKGLFVLTDDETLQVSRLAADMQLNDSEEEIDKEYLAFMEQTLTHRLKWNKVKEIKKKQSQSVNGNSESILNQDIISRIIEEHPDDIRNREMQQMYGSSAAQIHAMETAVQLTFDRISTIHNPTLWPNIPLKLHF